MIGAPVAINCLTSSELPSRDASSSRLPRSATAAVDVIILQKRLDIKQNKDFALSEKDFTLSKKDFTLSEKDFKLSKKDFTLSKKDSTLSEKDFTLSKKDLKLSKMDST